MTETTKSPLKPPTRKRKDPPPSQLSSGDDTTGQVIDEVSRDLAAGRKTRSTQPKKRLVKLTSRITPDLDAWIKELSGKHRREFPDERKLKQEEIVQAALLRLQKEDNALEILRNTRH